MLSPYMEYKSISSNKYCATIFEIKLNEMLMPNFYKTTGMLVVRGQIYLDLFRWAGVSGIECVWVCFVFWSNQGTNRPNAEHKAIAIEST